MKDINRVSKISNIDDSPFAKQMNTNFVYSRPDLRHGFPVDWFRPILNSAKIESCSTSSFIRKLPKISKLDPTNFRGLARTNTLYKFLYIPQT